MMHNFISYRQSENSMFKQRNYMVFEQNLMELFDRCMICTAANCLKTVSNISGTLVAVRQECSNCHACKPWTGQPSINGIPAGNIQLSA